MKKNLFILVLIVFSFRAHNQEISNQDIEKIVSEAVPSYINLYKHLHANPELSYYETESAKKMKEELTKSGFDVTSNFAGKAVIGLLKNGEGPVVMVRTDMDALPIKEKTGLAYASKKIMKNENGKEVHVMHACGHDMHMSVFSLTAHTLSQLKGYWKGTLVFVAQQAEEPGTGAKTLIKEGLFSKFPLPDYALAYHVSSSLPAGTIGFKEGPFFASVTSVDVTFKGIGGHGAYPHLTIDPVVMASRAILDYQTIVSREVLATKPAVLTVGSIHGGTKHNIIPDEVKLQITIRTYTTEVRDQITEAIERISKHVALSAGIPQYLLPVVEILPQSIAPVINDKELTNKAVESFESMIGSENLTKVNAAMVGEDFGEYGLTNEDIPVCLSWLGSVQPRKYNEAIEKGEQLPALHSPFYYPDIEKTLSTGAKCMTKAVINLLKP